MKIYINESSLSAIKNETEKYKLPKFIYKPLKNKRTSLGDNEAFPPERKYPFDYTIIKDRYKEVIDLVGDSSMTLEMAENEVAELMEVCKKMEKPIRPQLEKICFNFVNRIFAIPKETVNIDCRLVDSVKSEVKQRIMPEDNDENGYSFRDVDDIEQFDRSVMKRRLINSLIQGASYVGERMTRLYYNDVKQLNDSLPELYDRIIALGDYILFQKEVEYSDKDINLGAYVGVRLGKYGKKTEIKSQGIILPYLIRETLRGLYELFSSSGLPSDPKRSEHILRHSDFLVAEQWDLRFGVGLWKMITKDVDDTNKYPYIFSRLCQMKIDDFNKTLKNIFANTEYGKEEMEKLISDVNSDMEYQEFQNDINAKKIELSLITDDCFSSDELA